jgi:hypothetical protein
VVLLLLLPAGWYWLTGRSDRRLEMTGRARADGARARGGGELEMRGSGSDVEANLEV